MPLVQPIQAWVSDSITRLVVEFAAPAIQKFFDQTGRQLAEKSVGGLIQITEFEIVATHLGSRPFRLMIRINDLESLGLVKSAEKCMPRPLEDLPEIVALLARLKKLRSGDDDDSPSPVSNNGSRPGSQEPFATQISRPRHTKSSDMKAMKSNGTSHRGNSAASNNLTVGNPAKDLADFILSSSGKPTVPVVDRDKNFELLSKPSTRSEAYVAPVKPDEIASTTQDESQGVDERSEGAKTLPAVHEMVVDSPCTSSSKEINRKVGSLLKTNELEEGVAPMLSRVISPVS